MRPVLFLLPFVLSSSLTFSVIAQQTATPQPIQRDPQALGRFFNQEFLGQQSQIVLHEGVHLATRFGDRDLARAATGKTYPDTVNGNSRASQDWHDKLKSNCN